MVQDTQSLFSILSLSIFCHCCREHSVNDKPAADKANLKLNSNLSLNKQTAKCIAKEASVSELNVSLGESSQTTLLKDLLAFGLWEFLHCSKNETLDGEIQIWQHQE